MPTIEDDEEQISIAEALNDQHVSRVDNLLILGVQSTDGPRVVLVLESCCGRELYDLSPEQASAMAVGLNGAVAACTTQDKMVH